MQVTIYSQPNCHYCNAAKTLLDWNGISYMEIDKSDILKHLHKHEVLIKNSPLPQIFINDEHIGNYQQLVEYISQGKLFKGVKHE